MRFNKFRRAATILIAAFLLFLFIVPQMYLLRASETVFACCDAADAALERGDDAAVRTALARMQAAADATLPVCKLFLDHTAVDALAVAVGTAVPLTEPEAVRSAVAGIRVGMEALLGIERFHFAALF